MTLPEVSVLLPFRDAENHLSEALDSLARQTLHGIEVIMVDDSSRDASADIARAWSRRDRGYRVVPCAGEGLVDALNTGLSECGGRWVARMDADDVCAPKRMERQLALALEMGRRTVVTCRVRSFPDDVVTDGFRAYEEWLNGLVTHGEIERNMFVESPVPHPTAFYHRKSIIDEGGYTERTLPEDYELWLRLWSRGYRFARVPETLLYWRDSPDRHSRTDSAYSLTAFYTLKARYLERVPCMREKRVYVAGSGQTARRLGRCLQDNGFHIEAFLGVSEHEEGRRLRGRPVIHSRDFDPASGIPVVAASRQHGARGSIREFLEGLGLREWSDFVVCA